VVPSAVPVAVPKAAVLPSQSAPVVVPVAVSASAPVAAKSPVQSKPVAAIGATTPATAKVAPVAQAPSPVVAAPIAPLAPVASVAPASMAASTSQQAVVEDAPARRPMTECPDGRWVSNPSICVGGGSVANREVAAGPAVVGGQMQPAHSAMDAEEALDRAR